jgi:hypothetical protein
MSEAQHWHVHYLQNGDPQVERTRLLPSMYDALTAACALRQRHTVQYVGGPNGERYETDAIVKWCAENAKWISVSQENHKRLKPSG